MTVPRHISNSSIAQAVAVDALYDQALAFVQTNQDASCTGLQMHFKIGYGLALQLQQRLESHGALVGIESPIEPHKVIVRIVEQTNSPDHAVLELLASDNLGYQRLAATSPPMPEHAAKRIAGLYDKAHNITPTFASLKAVLAATGALAWASATSSASNAAMAASVQVCRSLKTQGVPLDAVNNVLVITAATPLYRR